MNAKRLVRRVVGSLVSAVIVVLTLAIVVSAQVRTQETVQTGAATQSVTVERGEVVWVSGNDVMIKMESGEMRHFPNVPESARVTVGGRQLGVHDLQPGMKLERTTVTTTAPRTIRTVRTVNGTVWQAIPPTSVILTLEDRTNQRFAIPKDQKFMVDGKEVDAFSLRKGMKISATAVTTSVETATETQARLAGRMPPPPPVPVNLPVMVVEAAPVPVPVAAAPEEPVLAAQLPKTGSPLPLVGLLGLLSCAASFGIRILRRS